MESTGFSVYSPPTAARPRAAASAASAAPSIRVAAAARGLVLGGSLDSHPEAGHAGGLRSCARAAGEHGGRERVLRRRRDVAVQVQA
jgi:hypothetical protein